jgi:cytochrome b pre-mRNA-processing protein 3
MLRLFRRHDPGAEAARRLHRHLIERARAPVFYTRHGVPDTLDGRFDLIALHAFLLMDALNRHGEEGRAVGTRLATEIFAGFEGALRELGVSDLGLSRRIKAMADAFYGRLGAYGSAGAEGALAAALLRNLYRGDDSRASDAALLADYVTRARAALASEETGPTLLQGEADFGPLPSET